MSIFNLRTQNRSIPPNTFRPNPQTKSRNFWGQNNPRHNVDPHLYMNPLAPCGNSLHIAALLRSSACTQAADPLLKICNIVITITKKCLRKIGHFGKVLSSSSYKYPNGDDCIRAVTSEKVYAVNWPVLEITSLRFLQ